MAAHNAVDVTAFNDEDIRKIDIETALCIASMAGVATHDSLGNALPSVWCKHNQTVQNETGFLLEADDLRKLLLEQMNAHIQRRQDLILETEDPAPVVHWILEFTQRWETEYRGMRERQYDISQRIYIVMVETYHVLEQGLAARHDRARIRRWKAEFDVEPAPPAPAQHLFRYEKARVRSVFRHPLLNPLLVRVASTLLQKKEVCNKAGAYSSKLQRHDITREIDYAIRELEEELEDDASPFNTLLRWDAATKNRLSVNLVHG
jgi:hypothetical protein